MKILGFNFVKISAERITNDFKDTKINTNIDVSDVSEVKSDIFDNKEKIITIKFVNTLDYEPGIAKLELVGNILLSVDKSTFEEVLKEWKKKTLPNEFRLKVFNLILRKSSLKSLQLEEELNLPLHMPMPHLKSSNDRGKTPSLESKK